MIEIKDVTLVCIDCNRYLQATEAILHSIRGITFNKVLFFSDKPLVVPESNIDYIEIPKINNKIDYCYFVMRRLHDYIQTSHMLIIQWDGFVLNPNAWTDEFLKYSYIGSPWWKYQNDGMMIGNGGFSLRTNKLMEFVSNSPIIKDFYPEDEKICRTYRKEIEKAGFTFAPIELAEQFSIEGCPAFPDKSTYNENFGFHNFQTTKFKK